MANFFSRSLNALRKYFGGGEAPAQPVQPSPPSPPERPHREAEYHQPRYLEGHDNVLPRWKIGQEGVPLSQSDAESLIRTIPRQQTYTITVHGISPFGISEYLSYDEAYISYVVDRQDLIQRLYDPDVDTGTGWINELIYTRTGYYWEEVWEVQVIDYQAEEEEP